MLQTKDHCTAITAAAARIRRYLDDRCPHPRTGDVAQCAVSDEFRQLISSEAGKARTAGLPTEPHTAYLNGPCAAAADVIERHLTAAAAAYVGKPAGAAHMCGTVRAAMQPTDVDRVRVLVELNNGGDRIRWVVASYPAGLAELGEWGNGHYLYDLDRALQSLTDAPAVQPVVPTQRTADDDCAFGGEPEHDHLACVDAADQRRAAEQEWTVEWEVTHRHEHTLSGAELAELAGIPLAELLAAAESGELDASLASALAELDGEPGHDSWQDTSREQIVVTPPV